MTAGRERRVVGRPIGHRRGPVRPPRIGSEIEQCDRDHLERVSELLSVSMSDIVREAIRNWIELHPLDELERQAAEDEGNSQLPISA